MKRILKAFGSRDRDLGDRIGLFMCFVGLIVFLVMVVQKYAGG